MSSPSKAASSELSEQLKRKIESRTAKVGVIGMGYVGLPLALLFSEQKFPVTGFDIDKKKIDVLQSGGSYIYRIAPTEIQAARAAGLHRDRRLRQHRQHGRHHHLRSHSVERVPRARPQLHHRNRRVDCAASARRPVGHSGEHHLSRHHRGSSGADPRALESVTELKAARAGLEGNNVFHVVFSPEREDPGNDTVARRDIPKVIGGLDPQAGELGAKLYGSIFNRTVPVSTPAAAEMTKLLENIYRCVNIAMVNELKLLCLRMGIDIWEVIDAAKSKPFGFQAFYPGPGLGGHCIPIDPFYLSWKAKQFDFRTRFIELAGEVNTNMPYFSVEAVANALNKQKKALNGAKILVLGLSYKRDIDDLRESPSLTIIELLQKRGAVVSYNDPYFPTVGHGRRYALNMTCSPLENLDQYDCVMIVTDHSDYDYPRIVRESKLVVDTRNATKGIDSPKIVRC